MNLYDCCMYFDEDLVLDLRLNILNDHVNNFVDDLDRAMKQMKYIFVIREKQKQGLT